MAQFFKRLGAGKKTKLARTPIGKLKTPIVKEEVSFPSHSRREASLWLNMKALDLLARLEHQHASPRAIAQARKHLDSINARLNLAGTTSVQLKWNLKNPSEREQFLRFVKRWGAEEKDEELVTIALTGKPITKKGFLVFVADFGRYPHLNSAGSPAHFRHGLVFVDARVPEMFKQFVVDHEIRENLIKRAGYSPHFRRASPLDEFFGMPTASRGHVIAVQREKRDLERAKLLQPFLEWLKPYNPEAYRDRLKAWKISSKRAKPS